MSRSSVSERENEEKTRKARAFFVFDSLHIAHLPGRRKLSTESELSELRAELAPPPSTSSSSSSATEGTITLLYATGWKEAFCHFSKDGRAWTEVPGLKLVASSTNPGGGDRQLRIEGTKRLDFVMTDGHGNWDTPVPSYALNTSSSGNGSSGNSSDGGGSDGDSGSSSRRRKAPNHYTIEQPGSYRLKSGKITKLD